MQTDARRLAEKMDNGENGRIACASGSVCVLAINSPKGSIIIQTQFNAKITWTIYVLWGFIFRSIYWPTEGRRVLRVEIPFKCVNCLSCVLMEVHATL